MADLIISGLVALARECKDRTDTMKFVAKECGELGERIENIMPLLQDSHIKDPNYMKQVATLRNTLEEANQFLIECQESDNTKNPRASITTKSSSSTTALADPDDVLEQVVMLQCAVKKFGNDFMSSQDRKGRAVALTSRIESLAMQLHIAMTANFTRMMEENARASEANFEYHIQKEDDQIKLLRQIKRQGRARAIETSPVITVFDNMSSGAAAMGSLLIYPITMWLAPPCITEIKGDGHGTVTLPDGTVYEGSWVNGKLTGKGRMTFPSGHFYDGDFKNGLKSGNGVYSYSTAGKALFDSYNGEWKHNQMHGSGAFTYSNGKSRKFWLL